MASSKTQKVRKRHKKQRERMVIEAKRRARRVQKHMQKRAQKEIRKKELEHEQLLLETIDSDTEVKVKATIQHKQEENPDTEKRQPQKKRNLWPLWVFFITFVISFVMSFLSETALSGVPLTVAILILFLLILLGIASDILGIAVTSGEMVSYNSMAAKRISGAKEAVTLIKKASVISNICNDVIGDVCGIVSGAMGAAIVASVFAGAGSKEELIFSVLVSAMTAAMTVSGKAAGKTIAIKYSREIVFFMGKIMAVFHFKKRG